MNTSQKLFSQAQQYIPGGVNSPVRAFKSVGGSPIFFKSAKGCMLTDVDDKNYIIHQVDNTGTYPKFTIFKNDKDGNPIEFGASISQSDLTSPTVDGLFITVENMQTVANWDSYNPISTKVPINHTTIYREDIEIELPDGTKETHLQKFRGIFEDADISKFLEKDYDNNGVLIVDSTGNPIKKHQGL